MSNEERFQVLVLRWLLHLGYRQKPRANHLIEDTTDFIENYEMLDERVNNESI